MQFTKTTVAVQALLLAVFVANTQAQFSDLTSELGGLGNSIASAATVDFSSIFSDATAGIDGATSDISVGNGQTVISYAPGASTSLSDGQVLSGTQSPSTTIATTISNSAASSATVAVSSFISSASSALSKGSNAALVNVNHGMPLNALVAIFTVFLGSAIAGTLIL